MSNLKLVKSKDKVGVVTNYEDLLRLCNLSSRSIFDLLTIFDKQPTIKILQVIARIRFLKSIFLIEDTFEKQDLDMLIDPFSHFKSDSNNDNIELLLNHFKKNWLSLKDEFVKNSIKAIIYYHKWLYYKSIVSSCEAHKYSVCPNFDLELSLYDDQAIKIKNQIDRQIASDLIYTLDTFSLYFQK